MNIKYPFRLAIVSCVFLFFSCLICVRILSIINSNEYSNIDHLKMSLIKADRGGIYTCNDKLLAITSSSYEIRFDGTYLNANRKDLLQLAQDLSLIFQDKSKQDYFKELQYARNKKYFLLNRDASFEEVESLKTISFYKKPLHGGVIINQYTDRQKPNLNAASRTIGDLYKGTDAPIYGLEYSYNSQLSGNDGQHLILHEPGLDRKIYNSENIKPIAGKDLIATIDLAYQDILDQALLRQLEFYEANFGTAVLMEVKTGKIKAISNLSKTTSNKYAETINLAVSHQIEPGSTFKTASMMAYFEDYISNINDTIDCKNGKYKFKGSPIITTDSKKMQIVSIQKAFAHSSNIGVGRLIVNNYGSDPNRFVNRLNNFGLTKKSHIDLEGVPTPKINSPNQKNWSGISLPWMSFGYGISLTAIDLLTFYNAIANNGYFLAPYFGYALREGSLVTKIVREDYSYRICSDLTIKKIKNLLREVVLDGTGSDLNRLPFAVSGKTGTTVKNYSQKQEKKEYQASFVGFFPSNSPKYTCIVIIDGPNVNKGFYGSQVAVPVFKEVATKIYYYEGARWDNDNYKISINNMSSISKLIESHTIDNPHLIEGCYPSVIGLHIRDAVPFLENYGYKVIIKGGMGNVQKQYPKENTKVHKNLAITLFT